MLIKIWYGLYQICLTFEFFKEPLHTGSKYYIGPLRNKKPLSQKTVICDHYEPKNYGKY